MSYDNAEPKVLKTLNSDGQVLDDAGNVINDTSDYWVQLYNQTEPKVDKILKSDGSVVDSSGTEIQVTTEFNLQKYNQAEPIPAKYLHSDGTIDENPGGGSADLEDNHQTTIDVSTYTEPVEVLPTQGKDGMAKATITLSNIPSGGGNFTAYAWTSSYYGVTYFDFDNAPQDASAFYEAFMMSGSVQEGKLNTLYVSHPGTVVGLIRASDTEFTIGVAHGSSVQSITFTRDSTKDLIAWVDELDTNKAQTIDVSQYSAPIEVTPTVGKDGMRKATITLSNIPSGGNLETNKQVTLDIWDYVGTNPEIIPSQDYDGMEKVTITLGNHASVGKSFALCDDDNGHGDQVLVQRPPTVGHKVWDVHNGTLYTITGVTDYNFTTDGGEGVYAYPPFN